ncbi:MAG: hypothetical protein GOVbin7581_35 [Prokaryotic dsDNA virus sp.]|nr:MAG: hypothetical protein GOVbin7581_35 [Prokaryotic dsDNA virus sp.]|tara:strand:+ start:14617 stop:15312 length:696 start_codon:yes stop_codon:yes gene_type:complete
MTTIQKIKKLLNLSKGKTYKIELYAEAILDDGRVIATEDDEMAIGSSVFVIGDDGSAQPLESGTYTLKDGTSIEIVDSKISVLGEEENEEEKEEMSETELRADEEAPKVEEVIEAEDDVSEEMAKKIYEETPDEVTEELSSEIAKMVVAFIEEKAMEDTPEEDKEEFSAIENSELVSELVNKIDELESKLEDSPASEGVKAVPVELSEYAHSKVDLTTMSVAERQRHYFNN